MEYTQYENEVCQIATQYEKEGYTVVLRPKDDAVPAFLAGFDLDLIATRGEERVVVEVRPNRRSLQEEAWVVQLAEVVNQQPAWRFDLVVLEQESSAQRMADTGQEPTDEQFENMLNRSRIAAGAGLNEMALTSAWAALEAAMRQVRDDAELYGGTKATELLRTLYGNGFLSRSEFDRAKTAWSIRTQTVHGFVPPEIEPSLIDDLLALAKKVKGSEDLKATPAAG